MYIHLLSSPSTGMYFTNPQCVPLSVSLINSSVGWALHRFMGSNPVQAMIFLNRSCIWPARAWAGKMRCFPQRKFPSRYFFVFYISYNKSSIDQASVGNFTLVTLCVFTDLPSILKYAKKDLGQKACWDVSPAGQQSVLVPTCSECPQHTHQSVPSIFISWILVLLKIA